MKFSKILGRVSAALALMAPVGVFGQTITSLSAVALPQHNANLTGVSAPTELLVRGTGFVSGATAKFSGTGFATFTTPTTYISSISLRVDTPQVPAAASSLAIQICNTSTNCSAPTALNILALTTPPGTLTPTAVTPVKYSFEADFGSTTGLTAGLPVGLVTFKEGGTTLGTATPTVKSQALVKAATPGTWTTNSNTATQRSVVADFDKDGLPDTAIYDSSTGVGTLHILLGANNRGDFNNDVPVSLGFSLSCSSFVDIVAGDFNNDGYADVAVLCNGGSVTSTSYIYLLINSGDATFTSNTLFPNRAASMIAAGDMNKDGNLDLIIGGPPAAGVTAAFMVMFGNGTGNFPTSKTSPATNAVGQQMLAVDLNNDGYPDLLTQDTGTTAVRAWKNDGSGGFPRTENYSRASATMRFSVGRVAGSPYPNLLLGSSGQVTQVNNNADGTVGFGNTGYVINVSNLKFFVAGDVTGDGSDDLVTYDGTNIAIYPWQSPFFATSPSVTIADAQATSFPGTGDFNADGFADVIALDDPKSTAPYSDKVQTYIASGVLKATLANQTFTPGAHTITATDPGTVAFAPGTAPTTVTSGYSDTVSFTVSPSSPATYTGGNNTLLLTVTYAAGQPGAQGTVTFYDGATAYGPFGLGIDPPYANPTQSSRAYGLTLSAGTHTLRAVYSGDANYAPVTPSNVTYVVNKGPQTINFTQPDTPATAGTSVTLSATGGGSTNPVIFSVVSGPATVSGTNGSTLAYTGAGTVVVAANQAGDANYNAAPQVTRTVTVTTPTTTSSVNSEPNPSTFGEDVSFFASITPSNEGGPDPTGTVTFYDGATPLGTGDLYYQQAYFDTASLTVGTHDITVEYAGDSYYSGSTSAVYQQVVDKAQVTVTWLQPANIIAGTALSAAQLNAIATDDNGNKIPGTFFYTPAAGTVFAAGPHLLSVTFTPSDAEDYNGGTASVTITVTAPTTDPGTLVATPNPATTLNSVVVQATFGDITSPAGLPFGTVTFKDGAATTGTAALAAGNEAFVGAKSTSFGDYNPSLLPPAVADFNRDGIPDAVVVSQNTFFTLFGADHYGALTAVGSDSLGFRSGCYNYTSVAAADFNGDGYPDLAVLCNTEIGNGVVVFLNYGNGTFNFNNPIYSDPGTDGGLLVVGDFNKDGKMDVAIAGELGNFGNNGNGISVLFGDGTGAFPTSKQTSTADSSIQDVRAADLNNDGYPDLVIIGKTSPLNVYKNDGTGGFGTGPVYSQTFASETQLFTAPVKGSSYPNLIVASAGSPGQISVIRNNGTAALSFNATVNSISVPNLQTVAIGDFNGDGNPDAAAYNGTNITVYNSSATGLYSTPLSTFSAAAAPANAQLAVTADANSDGYADVLVTVPSPDDSTPPMAQFFVTAGNAKATLPGATYASGTHPLTATVPATTTYAAGSAATSLVVNKATPGVSLAVSPVSPTTYSPTGTETLTVTVTSTAGSPFASGMVKFYDGTTLLATVTLTGATATTSTASATVGPLAAGTHPLTAQYQGDNTYAATNSASTSYVVNKGTPVITFVPNPSTFVYGTQLSGAQLDATATIGASTVAGTFIYNPAAGTTLSVGANQVITATFTPTDTANYNTPAPKMATVTVTKATPTVTWAMPAAITSGTPLSSTQLNATATNPVSGVTVAGTYNYNPPAGTVLNVGANQPLNVTFVPSDTTNYNNGSGSTTITVVAAGSTAPNTPVGSTSATQTVNVSITTAGTPNAINVLTQGAANKDFKFVSGGSCSTSTAYTVGQICTVQYSFAPASPGIRMGAVTLTSGTTVLGTSFINGVGTGPLGVILPGAISTVAGNGTRGYVASEDTGTTPATNAQIGPPSDLEFDGAGNLYFADYFNQRIRKVAAGTGFISTVAGNGTSGYVASQDTGSTPATSAQLSEPRGIAIDGAGNLYISDSNNHRIRKVAATTGFISTVAGNGTQGYTASQDTGTTAATATQLSTPNDVAVDGAGNLYIADSGNQRIRKVNASTGYISTVAGNGTAGYTASQDTGTTPATAASLYGPYGLNLDSAGNIYIADVNNYRVRKVTASTGYISTVAGNGTAGYSASEDTGTTAATAAKINLQGVSADAAGNLYIGDYSNSRIRKVTAATGFISTVAGNGTFSYVAADDTGTTAATKTALNAPSSAIADGFGNLFIADFGNYRIRKVTAAAAPQSFPITAVGATSPAQTNILSNNGNTPLTVSSIAVTTINFSQTGTTCTGTVAAGATCTIGSQFNPQNAGMQSGNATATDNSLNIPGSQQTVVLNGNATPGSKTINFTAPATPVAVNSTATLVASTSNGDPVTFSVISGTALISGTTITYNTSGTVVIAADSAATANYNAAPRVTQTVMVSQTSQTINFPQPATPVAIGSTATLSATGGNSGNPVVFSIQSGPATVSGTNGTTINYTGAGTVVIAANQAGNANYSAATTVTRTVTVSQTAQTINFTQPTTPVTVGATGTLVATGGASGNPVVFFISGGPATVSGTNGSTISYTGVGLVEIGASQMGNTNYAAAPVVFREVTVNQTPQTITFPQPPTPVAIGSTATLSATGGASGNPVVFSIQSGPATVSGTNGTTITYTGAGTVVIAANQAGNTSYSAAPTVTQSVVVSPASSSYNAGTVAVGSSSGTLTATVNITTSGPGGGPGSVSVVTQGATGLDFNVVTGGTCASMTNFTAGQTCTVLYAYTPKAAGTRNGGILIKTGGGATLGSSYLTGTGTGPQVEFTQANGPAPINLGGGFQRPASLAVDATGATYVSDGTDNSVKKVPAGCTTASCVTNIGGGYSSPVGVAVDGLGNVLVVDSGRLKSIPPGCTTSSCVSTLLTFGAASTGVAVDGGGNVYVDDTANRVVAKVPQGCTSSSCVVNLGGGFGTLAEGLAADNAGNVYVADTNNNAIKQVPSGCTNAGCVTTLGGGFASPYGVALAANGNLFVTDSSNGAVKSLPVNCTSASCVSTVFITGGGTAQALGLALDGRGNPYLAISGMSLVEEVDLADAPSLTFASTPIGSQSAQRIVTLTNNGNATALAISALNGTNADFGGAATTCTTSTSLAPTASCNLGVRFAPTTAGTPATGSASITDNNLNVAGSVQSISVSGDATPTTKTITFAPLASPVALGSTATLMATASNGDPVTFSVLSGNASITGNTVTYTTAGSVTIAANSAAMGNYQAAPQVTQSVTVNQGTQTITFTQPATPAAIGTSVTLSATGGASGNPVVFSVLSGPGTVSGPNGSTLTYTGAGTVVVAANQAGNANYAAAPQVTRTVTVNQTSQTITFTPPATPATFGTSVTLTATGGASGNPVVFSVISGPGTVSGTNGSTLTYTGAGTVVVAANQAGNANYAAAPQVTQSVVVNQASQAITFTPPATPATFGTSVTLTATGGASGNPVVFSVVSGPATVSGTNGSTLTYNGAGTVVVAANQAGNPNYAAAPQVTQSVTVNQASQTITFTPPASPATFGTSVTLTATGGASGNPVVFSVLSGPATVSGTNGSTLTYTGVGTVVVAANQAASANYAAAPQVTQSVTVNQASQTITFTSPASPATFGTSVTLTATGGASGNPVVFSVLSGPAAVSGTNGSTLTYTGVGTVVVAANQAASANYAAAPQVTQSVTVNQASQAITFAPPATPASIGTSVTLSATGGASGNPVVFSVTSGPATVSGPNGSTLTYTGAGTVVVAANQAGNANYAAATTVPRTVVVNQTAQTIIFTPPATPATFGTSATLTATGGASGNPVVFTVLSGPGMVSGTNGSTLTYTGVGTVVVAANQAGTADYAAAPQVTQSVVVNQAAQAISFTQPASPAMVGTSVALAATGGASGNPVVFSVLSGPASVSGSNGSTLTYNGAGTVVIAANQAASTNYSAAPQVTRSVTVGQATLTLNWPTPASIAYGTALSPTQLNATATNASGGTVPGVFTYNPPAGTILGVGSQPLSVTFVPTDTATYATQTATQSIAVTQTTPVIAFPSVGQVTDIVVPYTPTGSTLYQSNWTEALQGDQIAAAPKNGSTGTGVTFGNYVGKFNATAPGSTASFSFTPVLLNGNAVVHALFNTFRGSANLDAVVTFTNSAGQTATYSLVGNQTIRDYYDNTTLNYANGLQGNNSDPALGGVTATTWWTNFAGNSGYVRLDMQTFPLPAAWAGTSLTSIKIANPSNSNSDDVLSALQVMNGGSSTLAPIPYGTALGSTQLAATAINPITGGTVPGTFTFNPAAGTVLPAGTQNLGVTFVPTDAVDYRNAAASTSLVVNRATPTINWATPAAITAGTPLSAAQLNATAINPVTGATVPGTFTYTPTAGTVLPVGNNTLNVSFVPTDLANYLSTAGSVTQVVNPGTTMAPISSSLNPSTFGQAVTLTATLASTGSAPITGTVSFFDGTTPLGSATVSGGKASVTVATLTAGTHGISASYSGDANNGPASVTGFQQVVNQATPVVSWNMPASIVYGTALSAAQLNATATNAAGSALSGTFVYNPAAGTVLQVGTRALSVTFVPSDAVDYKNATGGTTIVVTQATPVISWATPAAITAGTPLSATQLNATALGVGGVTLPGTFIYAPAAGTVLPTGNNTLNVSFTPTDALNYKSATGSVTQVVNAAVTTITVTSSLNPSTFGQPVTLTATLSSVYTGASASGTVSFFDGTTALSSGTVTGGVVSITTSALTAGTHNITAAYGGDANFASGTSAVLAQVVNKAATVISWSTPASIVYGTPLSGAQLNATAATTGGVNIPGTFVYTPAAGTVLGAGTRTLGVSFTPTDAANFSAATGQVNLLVTQATPTITWTAPASISAGTPLSGTQLNATATGIGGVALPGTFTYNPASGTVLPVGNTILRVTFVPTDAVDYTTANGSVPITVSSAVTTAVLTSSANPSPYGAPVTLTATLSSVFTAAPISGTVSFFDGAASLGTGTISGGVATFTTSALATGAHNITTVYSGDANFGTVTSAVLTQTVNAGVTTISWATPAAIVYGTPLSAVQLNATVTAPNAASVPGTFVYTPTAGTILAAGTQTLRVVFTPTDTLNFKTATASVSLLVNQATPSIIWATPTDVVAGTVLSATQLNATATGVAGSALPGVFVYTPPSGTVVTAGVKTLSVTFTPTDAANYTTASKAVNLNVISVTLTSLSTTAALLGDPAKTITLTGTGFVSNSVVTADGTPVATTFVNGTTLTAVIPAASFTTVHTIPVFVTDPTQGQTSNTLNIAVAVAPLNATVTAPATVTPGAQPTVSFAVTNTYPVPVTATFTMTFTPAAGLPNDQTVLFANGTRTVTVTVPAGSSTPIPLPLQSGSIAGTITITSTFAAGGVNVTPSGGAQTVTIASPAAVPGISSTTLTRSGKSLTVVTLIYSNTRAVDHVTFHFVPAPGQKIGTPDVTVDGSLFAAYYASAASLPYGSAAVYTQTFTLDEEASVVGEVDVTVVNAIGNSLAGSAK